MKRSLILFPLFLLFIYIVLSSIDRSDYKLEKKFRSMQNKFIQLAQNPKIITDSQFNDIENDCRYIILRKPDSSIGFATRGYLVRLYIAQEKWTDSLGALRTILLDYGNSPYMDLSTAKQIILSVDQISVEKLHDPGLAIIIYQNFIKKYPSNPINNYLEKNINSLKRSPSFAN